MPLQYPNFLLQAKVLFIDDEPEFIKPHVEALEEEGYEVIQEMNPDEALRRLSSPNEKFDLIILDLLMPPLAIDDGKGDDYSNVDMRRTGVRVHNLIRNKLRLTRLPIIFLSVVRDPQIRTEIDKLERKFFRKPIWLPKPALPSDLIDEVRKALAR